MRKLENKVAVITFGTYSLYSILNRAGLFYLTEVKY